MLSTWTVTYMDGNDDEQTDVFGTFGEANTRCHFLADRGRDYYLTEIDHRGIHYGRVPTMRPASRAAQAAEVTSRVSRDWQRFAESMSDGLETLTGLTGTEEREAQIIVQRDEALWNAAFFKARFNGHDDRAARVIADANEGPVW